MRMPRQPNRNLNPAPTRRGSRRSTYTETRVYEGRNCREHGAHDPIPLAPAPMQDSEEDRAGAWQGNDLRKAMQQQINALHTILDACAMAKEPKAQTTPNATASAALGLSEEAHHFLLTLFLLSKQTTTPIRPATVSASLRSRLQIGGAACEWLEQAGLVITEGTEAVALTETGVQIGWQLV